MERVWIGAGVTQRTAVSPAAWQPRPAPVGQPVPTFPPDAGLVPWSGLCTSQKTYPWNPPQPDSSSKLLLPSQLRKSNSVYFSFGCRVKFSCAFWTHKDDTLPYLTLSYLFEPFNGRWVLSAPSRPRNPQAFQIISLRSRYFSSFLFYPHIASLSSNLCWIYKLRCQLPESSLPVEDIGAEFNLSSFARELSSFRGCAQ